MWTFNKVHVSKLISVTNVIQNTRCFVLWNITKGVNTEYVVSVESMQTLQYLIDHSIDKKKSAIILTIYSILWFN